MSNYDIHEMMDRAHFAEIREQRLRIEVDRLEAENARLAIDISEITKAAEVWLRRRNEIASQRDRLAAALREIAKGNARDGGPADPAEFARAALAGTAEPAKPDGAEVRWVLDGKVYARPSVTDLLTEAEHDLEGQGEVGFYSNDARIQSGTGFARVRELLAGTADLGKSPESQSGYDSPKFVKSAVQSEVKP